MILKWFTAIGSVAMGIIGFAMLIASCSAVQNSPTIPSDDLVAINAGSGADQAAALAPGFEIFDESKLKESSAPAWTVYAVAYEVCGERLAIQYIGSSQFLMLRKREAKTDSDKHDFAEAVAEFDEVIKHHGNARVEELDNECVRT